MLLLLQRSVCNLFMHTLANAIFTVVTPLRPVVDQIKTYNIVLQAKPTHKISFGVWGFWAFQKHHNRTEEKTRENLPKIALIYVECDLDALSVYLSVCPFGIQHTTLGLRPAYPNSCFPQFVYAIFDCVVVAAFKLSFPFLVHLISHSVIWKLKMCNGRRRRWQCSTHFTSMWESGDDRQRDVERVYLFVKKFLCFLYYSCDDDLQWRRSSDWIACRRVCYNSR